MATSSILKNFVIDDKKAANEIAKSLVQADKTPLPTMRQKRNFKMLSNEDARLFLKDIKRVR